jgi:hypothetical protein
LLWSPCSRSRFLPGGHSPLHIFHMHFLPSCLSTFANVLFLSSSRVAQWCSWPARLYNSFQPVYFLIHRNKVRWGGNMKDEPQATSFFLMLKANVSSKRAIRK